MGKTNCILATLLANSLIMQTIAVTLNITNQTGTFFKKPSVPANHALRPETSNPLAKAKPLPKSKMISKGNLPASDHVSNAVFFSALEGIRNNNNDMTMATVLS
jgi:hypothetical protein